MQELSLLDFGVDLGEDKKEAKKEVKEPKKSSKEKSEPVKQSAIAKNKAKQVENVKVTGEWSIHFATETFKVSDFVEEIPEEGVSLEDVREGMERSFAQFSAARTKWDVDKENLRLFPDAFAGSKGGDLLMQVPFFTNVEDANSYEGSLCYVVGANGQVYEFRKSLWGNVLVKTNKVQNLEKVTEQFTFHLPKIPAVQFAQILSFFKAYTQKGEYEVMICVYWDKEQEMYVLDCPKQIVTKIRIEKELNPAYGGRNSLRYLKILEIHSHNTMGAYFSTTDDADEQQFGLYGVVGRLDQKSLEIIIRVKVNDNQLSIPITEVFDTDFTGTPLEYPKEWEKNVQLRGVY